MSKQLNFIWIDDAPERKESAENLGEALNVKVEFVDVSTSDSETKLANILEGTEPDMIIIDHNLKDIESGIFKKGSTVATYIRERFFDCPIISISANVDDVDTQQKALYVDIFPIEHISNYYSIIISIAESFNTLKSNRPTNTDELIALLGTPDDDKINLANILPTTLKNDYSNKSLLVEIAQWVKAVFIKRPGFLYDKLWVATIIGIKEESFEKVAEKFEAAKYKGVFSNVTEERWWKSEVLSILYSIVDEGTYPWVRGRGLENIKDEDYSVCHASGEPFPETVAFNDTTPDARQVPIKIRYSELHPDYESLLYFEDIRLMTAAQ